MSRLSIEISPEEHQRIKMMAILQKKTIKNYILDRTLGTPNDDEEQAVVELAAVLDERIRDAEKNGVSPHTIDEIFEQARKKVTAKAS